MVVYEAKTYTTQNVHDCDTILQNIPFNANFYVTKNWHIFMDHPAHKNRIITDDDHSVLW